MRKLALLLANLLIVANGCVISPRRTVGSTGGSGGGNSEFSVSANPTSQIVTAGGSATYTISISAVNGFTGTVSLSASSSDSNIIASFDNTTIIGGSGSAVLTVSTTAATPAGSATITVTATDSSNNVSQNVAVTATIQAAASSAGAMSAAASVATQPGCVSTPTGPTAQRVSFPLSPTKGFTATFSVTSSSTMDASLGFFVPSSSKQPSLSSMINFNPAGIIQIRNGDSFISSAVPYAAGETLQFRLVENLPATTYSLFVTSPGAAEVPLATDLQVPSDQRGTTTLGGWGLIVNAPEGATLAVCNLSLH